MGGGGLVGGGVGVVFFFSSRRRHTRLVRDWSSDVCSSDLHEVHQDYQDVPLSDMYVDNAAMQLVRDPKQFDVILTQNLFGDILSDITAMITGSMGMLPSASIGENHAMYEPVHGTAPEIAGQNKANPIARSEEHTSELQSRTNLVCRLLLEKKKNTKKQ